MRALWLILLLVVVVAVSFGSMLGFVFSEGVSVITAPRIVLSTAPIPSAFTSTPPTASPTLTPNPTATPTLDSAAEGSFGGKGYFRITSPTGDGLYDGGNLTLTIRGEAIDQSLTMAYSIDRQEKIPFGATVKQAHDWDKSFGIITVSEALPPLPSGLHTLTVYGYLANVSAQANVDFIVA